MVDMANGTASTPAVATVLVLADADTVFEPIRDVASRHSDTWNVFCVSSEDGALRFLAELGKVDVFVVQPGPVIDDTVRLLERVRTDAPHSARIALVSPDEPFASMRLAPLAHQTLTLPVDAEALGAFIERMRSASQTELLDPVRALVGQVDRLPTPPAMFQRLTDLLASDDWDLDHLAAEVGRDAALTGEILKLVNSSYHGASRKITAISQAISLIGVNATRFVVLGNQIFQSGAGFETWIDLERLADRSRAVSLGAQSLAIRFDERLDQITAASLAGLVSEIGLLVLARIPDIADSIAAPVNTSTYLGAERVLFGGDRFEVGSLLLTLWGFDDDIVTAVRRLSTGASSELGEVAWYLAAARQLVTGDGIDPNDLARSPGELPAVDEAIDALLTHREGSAVA